ncbi:BppU family phage baseplate upper protein [Bacillus atrophaeus]|uniref:BppU family phage baseplate upper protein n=1 Tax=Bacillus atrophaeus TaxID=1452 RepID=UPI0022808C75|nr:BppU family phage baseplate upper protein [Bacillus atrophaeus]MCY9198924.1 BppU family phage baseplate upper protein [Bacillus atrophaeus]
MIHNNAELSFEVTARTKSNIKTGIQFSTQDIDTARLIFTLTKDGVPLPLSAVSGKLVMFMSDGSRFIKNVEIVDKFEGIAQYTFTTDEIKHYGEVNAELNLYYANNQALSVHKFSFIIDKALIDMDVVPVAEYYIDDFEALREKVNELYDQAIQTIEDLRAKFADLEAIETKEGAQAKVDAHAKDTNNPHNVTSKQINVIESKPSADYSGNDLPAGISVYSVTSGSQGYPATFGVIQSFKESDSRLVQNFVSGDSNVSTTNHMWFRRWYSTSGWSEWIELETTAGAQTKVDAHANNSDIHVTVSDKTKWNGSQAFKLTEDNGRAIVKSKTDFNTLLDTGYYAINSASTNSPVAGTGYAVEVIRTVSTCFQIAYREANPSAIYLRRGYNVTTSPVWTTWERLLTDVDLNGTWNTATLINGAQHNSGYPFQFSVVNNVLWLRGSFGALPAVGTVIAKFTYKPSKLVDFLVPTIGSYGYARFAFTEAGELRFDGISATDTSNVSRVSFNTRIPLW